MAGDAIPTASIILVVQPPTTDHDWVAKEYKKHGRVASISQINVATVAVSYEQAISPKALAALNGQKLHPKTKTQHHFTASYLTVCCLPLAQHATGPPLCIHDSTTKYVAQIRGHPLCETEREEREREREREKGERS
jgi:hypothetical protein